MSSSGISVVGSLSVIRVPVDTRVAPSLVYQSRNLITNLGLKALPVLLGNASNASAFSVASMLIGFNASPPSAAATDTVGIVDITRGYSATLSTVYPPDGYTVEFDGYMPATDGNASMLMQVATQTVGQPNPIAPLTNLYGIDITGALPANFPSAGVYTCVSADTGTVNSLVTLPAGVYGSPGVTVVLYKNGSPVATQTLAAGTYGTTQTLPALTTTVVASDTLRLGFVGSTVADNSSRVTEEAIYLRNGDVFAKKILTQVVGPNVVLGIPKNPTFGLLFKHGFTFSAG